MKKLIAINEDFIKEERTKLSAAISAGSNVTLTIENNNGLTIYDYIVIGLEGSDKAEMQQINEAIVAGQSIRVATVLFAHKAGEPITLYKFNKRKFYGSLTENGVYAELTADGSPANIEVDDPQGTKLEYTGSEGYAYFKSTYFNSQTDTETDISDSVAVRGDQSDRYASIYGIRKMAGFTENPFITDGRIEDKRRQAENEINSMLLARYSLPLAEVPPLLTYVCECLAAGYMHYEEYGPEGDAVKKLGEARGILKGIVEGRQKLLASNLTELATVRSASGLYGKPDGSETGDEKRKFSIGMKF